MSSYLTIYLVTGELPTIPDSLLALLGIGLANDWIGKLINYSQAEKTDKRHQDLQTQGFFVDILTDERGISIARLQFLLFNVAAGLYFARYVLKTCAMPTFDAQLLTLLGVSSAALLAAKTQENLVNPNTPAVQQPAPVANALPGLPAQPMPSASPALPSPVQALLPAGIPATRPAEEDDNMAPPLPDGPGMAPANLALG